MTTKRKFVFGATLSLLILDVGIHFYKQFQNFLTVANEPPGWPHSFSWVAHSLACVAWNTFAGTLVTIATPLGIFALALVIVGYSSTKPPSSQKNQDGISEKAPT